MTTVNDLLDALGTALAARSTEEVQTDLQGYASASTYDEARRSGAAFEDTLLDFIVERLEVRKMSTRPKNAAAMLEQAADTLLLEPRHDGGWSRSYRGCCDALRRVYLDHWWGRTIKEQRELDETYIVAKMRFAAMFYRDTESSFWWPRDHRYVEARVLALLFAAASLRNP